MWKKEQPYMNKMAFERFLENNWNRIGNSNCFENKKGLIRIFLKDCGINVSTKNYMGDFVHLYDFAYETIIIRNGQVVIELKLS